jgi:hypothetical protein
MLLGLRDHIFDDNFLFLSLTISFLLLYLEGSLVIDRNADRHWAPLVSFFLYFIILKR